MLLVIFCYFIWIWDNILVDNNFSICLILVYKRTAESRHNSNCLICLSTLSSIRMNHWIIWGIVFCVQRHNYDEYSIYWTHANLHHEDGRHSNLHSHFIKWNQRKNWMSTHSNKTLIIVPQSIHRLVSKWQMHRGKKILPIYEFK